MSVETPLLEGVRVLDLSRVLAGPFAGQILAEMGAEVIKVEPPQGDPARGIGPVRDGMSLYFACANSGKRSVVLDLRSAAGLRGLEALLADAHVLLSNLRPGSLARLGLDRGSIHARHPALVIVNITGFAGSSDRADEGAYDMIAQAEAGLMAVTGEPGGRPVRTGPAVADLAAGLWASLAAVSGLLAARNEGRGHFIEVPLVDAGLTLLSYLATGALETGVDPGPVGSGHHSIVPYRAYACRDGWVVITVIDDKFWPVLCSALGLEDLARRADLASNRGRVAARVEIDRAVEEAVADLTREQALDRLRGAGVPAAPIRSVLEAITSPYVSERGGVQTVGTGTRAYRTLPGLLASKRPLRPAPRLGEHTAEVLTEVLGAGSPLLVDLIG